MLNSTRPFNIRVLFTNFIFSATVIIICIIYYRQGLNKFLAFTDIENPVQTIDGINDEYLAGCTNKSIGTDKRTFNGKTILAYNCQQPLNPCLISICNGNRICEEQLKENATCSQDSNCNSTFKCDLDLCSCVENPRFPPCIQDSDCPTIDNNPCEGYTCINQTCVLDTLDGMECSNSQSCLEDQFCTNGCTCTSLNETNTGFCQDNSECPTIDNNSCENYTCVGNECILDVLPGMECANNQGCGSEQFCGTDCMCVSVNETNIVNCTTDMDCPLIDNNPCENYTCQSEICVLDTKSGEECSNNQECGAKEFCGIGCTCVADNSTSTGGCSQNSECPTVSNNPCANYTCQMGNCVLDTLAGNECSTSQECVTNELCDSMCTCVPLILKEERLNQTLTISFPGGSTPHDVSYLRTGKQVLLHFNLLTGTASGTGLISSGSGVIPAGYEPDVSAGVSYSFYMLRGQTGGTYTTIMLSVINDGFTFYSNQNFDNFASGGFSVEAFTAVWIVP